MLTRLPIRGRTVVDISHEDRIERKGRHARFLSVHGAHEARIALLSAAGVAPQGSELTLYVGSLWPCGELTDNQWHEVTSRVDLTIEGSDPEAVAQWVAAARGEQNAQ